MTIKEFFRKYATDLVKLQELEAKLKMLDSPKVAIARTDKTKVQGGKTFNQDDRILKAGLTRETIEWDIEMTKLEIERADLLLSIVGDDDTCSIVYLKLKYLKCYSISKISKENGVSISKIKKLIDNTEESLNRLIS